MFKALAQALGAVFLGRPVLFGLAHSVSAPVGCRAPWYLLLLLLVLCCCLWRVYANAGVVVPWCRCFARVDRVKPGSRVSFGSGTTNCSTPCSFLERRRSLTSGACLFVVWFLTSAWTLDAHYIELQDSVRSSWPSATSLVSVVATWSLDRGRMCVYVHEGGKAKTD